MHVVWSKRLSSWLCLLSSHLRTYSWQKDSSKLLDNLNTSVRKHKGLDARPKDSPCSIYHFPLVNNYSYEEIAIYMFNRKYIHLQITTETFSTISAYWSHFKFIYHFQITPRKKSRHIAVAPWKKNKKNKLLWKKEIPNLGNLGGCKSLQAQSLETFSGSIRSTNSRWLAELLAIVFAAMRAASLASSTGHGFVDTYFTYSVAVFWGEKIDKSTPSLIKSTKSIYNYVQWW